MGSTLNLISITRLFKICIIGFFFVILSTKGYGQEVNRNALLVIDIQENLVNPGSKIHIDTAGIDYFFLNLNTSITRFKGRQDLVIYIVNEWTNPFVNWETGNVCKKGGFGVGLDKRLVLVNDQVYSKSKPNALTNKSLLKYLKDNHINHVYVEGLLAEGCVKATVKGLRKEKFNVTVIEDALGSKNNVHKSKVIDYLRKNDIKTVKTNGI